MKGELAAFVDTSVLVYAVCADQPHKQRLARSIVERGFIEGCYATSTQDLVELYDPPHPSGRGEALRDGGRRLRPRATILEAECTRVLSGSLPAGRTYAGVRVENPFA